MRSDSYSKFAATFTKLTAKNGEGFAPFRWQSRLFRRMAAGNLPRAVDIPTGLGKTSVMALWLIASATNAKLPKRLVYVVDRRAVVDQATREAERLRANLSPELADELKLDGKPLPISTLRGGFADNREWLEDPSIPAIVVGTVDMVGSRLLFEGYGVSRAMRPYHAGFLGVDALVVLDEAHLCEPFNALLRDIAENRDVKFGPISSEANLSATTPPFQLMSLSATGRERKETTADALDDAVFRLDDEDREDEAVRQRLGACKRLKVVEVEDAKTLPTKLAERAIELGYGDPPSRVLVYCHSRREAVAVKKQIDKATKSKLNDLPSATSELLVGERRVHERKRLEDWLEDRGFLGGAEFSCDTPAFLVATSAGEVGVDLDADHMVCDLVAYERMVQRLGRVNRRGGSERHAIVDVFAARPVLKANAGKDAKVQHEVNLRTFEAQKNALDKLPVGEDGRRDASPQAARQSRYDHAEVIQRAMTPAPLHPALTRALLEAWAMTSLREHEGRPEVQPWLRGWQDQEEPHVNVVWRSWLPMKRVGGEISAQQTLVSPYFRAAPIHSSEKLEAELDHVSKWLLQRVRRSKTRVAQGLADEVDEIAALIVDQSGEYVDFATLSALQQTLEDRQGKLAWERKLAGNVLVLDRRFLGLRDGMLDERAEISSVATADADDAWRALTEDNETNRPVIKFRVQRLTAEDEGLSAPELEDWLHVRTFETDFTDSGDVRHGLAVYKWSDQVADDDDDANSIRSKPQALRDHAEQVATYAREIGEQLGLPEDEVDALQRAARFHDDGKAAERWQNAMNAPADGRPYAKTRGGGDWRLLEGYRHEFGSLLRARRTLLPTATRDLILHLIAAHHGHSRPLITTAGCEEGPPSVLNAEAGEAALRYARLQRSYGVWGLAWREAILRAADQKASREWSQGPRDSSRG